MMDSFLDANSTDLRLRRATLEESIQIWINTSEEWKDSLTASVYLKESLYLTAVPLAKDDGMCLWILTNGAPPGERPILSSCETILKPSLTSTSTGEIEDILIYGIASVFCPNTYRRRGYAVRMMKELAQMLHNWQTPSERSSSIRVIGSVLYSDIGAPYYKALGWQPNPTNWHLELTPSSISSAKWPSTARPVYESDLAVLCAQDTAMVYQIMASPITENKRRITVLPTLDHMLWHIGKETFVTNYLFQRVPSAKGAVAGPPGRRVWVIWTHRYYGRYDAAKTDNVLYVLRLVIEGDETANQVATTTTVPTVVMGKEVKQVDVVKKESDQVEYLEAVLKAAQCEAREWKLDCVKIWEPSPCVQQMLPKMDIESVRVEREEDSVACGYWYKEDGSKEEDLPLWINNEHYAWL